jgi:hypothetical protein
MMVVANFYSSENGKKIGWLKKSRLVLQMARNRKRIVSGTGFVEQLTMVSAILRIPPAVPGVVVECGSYQGASTASLSLACELTGRRLYVFDSFEGLPEPSQSDRKHLVMSTDEIHSYERGAWSGSLDLVRRNIEKFGAIRTCEFVPGYFEDTLPKLAEPVVFAFCDVDLRDSLKTCLRYLWPLLQDGCALFTHEAHHHEIASLFYDPGYWQTNLGCSPPGLVGAGSGLGLSPLKRGFYGSCIGYATKNPRPAVEVKELGVSERVRIAIDKTSSR